MSSVTIFTSDFFHFLTRAYSSDQVALVKWTKHSDLFRTIIVTHNYWWAVVVLDLVTQNPSFAILDSFGVRGSWEWSGPKTNPGPLPPLFQPPVTQQKEGHSCGVRLLMNHLEPPWGSL